MPKAQAVRPQVTGVTLNVLYPDGHTRTYTIDPRQVIGLFWHDDSVRGILAEFYKKSPQHKTRAELEAALGKKLAKRVMGQAEEIDVTDKTISDLWDASEEGQHLVSFLGKGVIRPPFNPEHA